MRIRTYFHRPEIGTMNGMIGLMIAYAISTVIVMMVIASAVITCIVVVRAVMSAAIGAIMVRPREIEMVVVGVGDVDAERPASTVYIYRTVEVGRLHEPAELTVAQHPAQVVVAHVQIVVIAVQGPLFASKHVVHQISDAGDKVVVYLVHIVVLLCIEIQFVGHLVRKEKSFLAHFAVAHCRTA